MAWEESPQRLSLRKLLIQNATEQGGVCVPMECARAALTGSDGGMVMVNNLVRELWRGDEAQDIAEYAVMLAVILVIVVGTIRLIGGNANNVFSAVASSISQ